MKKCVLVFLASSLFMPPSPAMILELYEAAHNDKSTTANISASVLTKRVKKMANLAQHAVLKPETIYRAFPRHDKTAQCIVLAHWLSAQPLEKNRDAMLGIFLRANKLCSRKQSKNTHFLHKAFATHEPLFYALGTVMSNERYPATIPLKPFYQFMNHGRQKELRRKLYAHSQLEPAQIDLIVFNLMQELARYDRV